MLDNYMVMDEYWARQEKDLIPLDEAMKEIEIDDMEELE
jgi:hypothetical protein